MTRNYLFHQGVLLGLSTMLTLATGCGDDESGTTVTSSVGDASATGSGGTVSDTSDSTPTSADTGGTQSGTSDTTPTTDTTPTSGSGSDDTTPTSGSGSDDTTPTSGSGSDDTTPTSGSESGTTGGTDDGTTSGVVSATGSDDGNNTGNNTGNNGQCQAPAEYTDCDGQPGNLTTDPFQALGINCGNDPATTVVAANATMNSVNNNAWRIATVFGTANQLQNENRYNGKLWAANLDPWTNPDNEEIPNNTSTAVLLLSTGVISAANAQGVVTEANGSQDGNGNNNNQDGGGLPAPLSANYGSNNGLGGTPFMDCDGINDCSDSLYDHWYVNGWDDPYDKLWMQFDLTTPEGTEGYVFDFAYFSSEYPVYYDTQFNDLFIAWSTSETYTGNITFVNDSPLTITSLEDAGAFQYKNNAPQLAGTGFEGHAGTGWFTARGSTMPNENFQITFFIADMADSILATGVILDNFRWECSGCVPSEVDSCGIAPQ